MQQPDGLMAFHPDKCSVLSVTKKKQPNTTQLHPP